MDVDRVGSNSISFRLCAGHLAPHTWENGPRTKVVLLNLDPSSGLPSQRETESIICRSMGMPLSHEVEHCVPLFKVIFPSNGLPPVRPHLLLSLPERDHRLETVFRCLKLWGTSHLNCQLCYLPHLWRWAGDMEPLRTLVPSMHTGMPRSQNTWRPIVQTHMHHDDLVHVGLNSAPS